MSNRRGLLGNMSAHIPETKRTFLSLRGDMQVTSSAYKGDRSVPQQMFFVSAIRPKITTRCRDQSPLPLCRVPPLSAAFHLSNPTHTADGWKKSKKRERRRESSHDSLSSWVDLGRRSLLFTCRGLDVSTVSSRLISISPEALSNPRFSSSSSLSWF